MQIPLTISSVNNPDNWFDMTVRFEKSRSGDGSLKVDGITQESSKPFRIMTGAGSKSSTISYSQNSASQTNILITITDRYGFETSYQRSTVFKPNPLMMQVDNYIKIKPHETGSMYIQIEEKAYEDTFELYLYGDVGGDMFQVTLNGYMPQNGEMVEMPAGYCQIGFFSYGSNRFYVTLVCKDRYGQSKETTIEIYSSYYD